MESHSDRTEILFSSAARLEEALALVLQSHPVLVAERSVHAEQTRRHAWETVFTLGYSITDTFESGTVGPNAAIRVRIPLWDRSTELESARAAWGRTEDATRVAFLADIQDLCAQAARVHALNTLRAFHRDRLTYRQEQVDQGLAEPDTLWVETEAAQRAEHDWQREAGTLQAQRITLARRYGGEEWGGLHALLEAMSR